MNRSPSVGRPEILIGENLVVADGDARLLDVARISLREGEILAILGPNGSGKSTLLRVLAMLQSPAGGRVTFRDRCGPEAEERLRLSAAFVFQRPHIWAGSVRANVELGLRLRRRRPAETREGAAVAAELIGIGALLDRDARTLSGGEAQRTAIARALAVSPEILFLDEPTANLDISARASLLEDLEKIARGGRRTTLIATHDRAEAFSLADRVTVLRGGRIIQQGTPADLFENPTDPFIAAVTGAELSFHAEVLESRDGVLRVRAGDASFTVMGSAEPGCEVRIAYRPEDLFLSRSEVTDGSPRNRFRATVAQVRSTGILLRVRLEGPIGWVAVITRAAGDELSLEPGTDVWVQIKATALHAFAV